jgi:hypothetical protein
MIDDVFAEVRAARDGGANGSIIGRHTFQLPKVRALDLLNKITSTRVELLAAAQDAGELAWWRDYRSRSWRGSCGDGRSSSSQRSSGRWSIAVLAKHLGRGEDLSTGAVQYLGRGEKLGAQIERRGRPFG